MATVVNPPYISQQILDDNGKPLSSGKLKFFRNNTDIPNSVYTSDGSTALGPEITLDSAGFPETQYALVQDREYTVKAFDSDGALIWTRNNIVGCGTTGSGPSGDYIPMTGTSIGDPIVGSLVWKDGQYIGTANQHGMVLTDTREGASILSREGLDTVVGDLEGDYRYYQTRLTNTQNGFPGYPDIAELTTQALTLNKETSQNGTRVSKQIDIRPSTTAAGENKITSKGNLNIETYPGGNLHLSGNILSIGAASSIELIPPNPGNVIITNGGGLTTNKLAIGTNLSNKEVNDIWTSASTGEPTDSQLITAKAALSGGGGSTAVCVENCPLVTTGIDSLGAWYIYGSSVVASAGGTFSKIGFGIPPSQSLWNVKVALAVYSYDGYTGTLVARTAPTTVSWSYEYPVMWLDAESSFSLTAGNLYLFALCTDSASINFYLGSSSSTDTVVAPLCGMVYPLTEMPATVTATSTLQKFPFMAVK